MATRKRLPRQRQPFAVERRYARRLRKLVKALRKPVVAALAKLAAEAKKADALVVVDGVVARRDAKRNVDPVTRSLSGVKAQFDTTVKKAAPGLIAQGFADETVTFASKASAEVFRGVVEIDAGDLDVPTTQWTKDNARLIVRLADDLYDGIAKVIEDGWISGTPTPKIAGEVAGRFGIADRRAKLIARDQIGSLNARVTEKRQADLGISEYTWRNVGDERVRGRPDGLYPRAKYSHWAREGEVFSWSKPPPDGHPGRPIACRCYAEPVLPDDLFGDE